MDVRNCKKCGNLFDYTGNPVCPACEKQMEEKFLEVRQYIYDNPGASMPTVAEDMDIPIQQIKKWIRQERLCFTKDSGVSIDCEKCGRPILTGRFCPECKKSMANTLNNLYVTTAPPKDKKSAGAKMRFLGN